MKTGLGWSKFLFALRELPSTEGSPGIDHGRSAEVCDSRAMMA